MIEGVSRKNFQNAAKEVAVDGAHFISLLATYADLNGTVYAGDVLEYSKGLNAEELGKVLCICIEGTVRTIQDSSLTAKEQEIRIKQYGILLKELSPAFKIGVQQELQRPVGSSL